MYGLVFEFMANNYIKSKTYFHIVCCVVSTFLLAFQRVRRTHNNWEYYPKQYQGEEKTGKDPSPCSETRTFITDHLLFNYVMRGRHLWSSPAELLASFSKNFLQTLVCTFVGHYLNMSCGLLYNLSIGVRSSLTNCIVYFYPNWIATFIQWTLLQIHPKRKATWDWPYKFITELLLASWAIFLYELLLLPRY